MRSLFFGLCLAVSLAACGAILNSKTDAVRISSEPSGADVYIDDRLVGVSPTTVDMSISDSHTVTVEMDGYMSSTQTVHANSGGGWIVADVLLTLLLGVIIDAVTDGWNELSTDHVHVRLISEADDAGLGPSQPTQNSEFAP